MASVVGGDGDDVGGLGGGAQGSETEKRQVASVWESEVAEIIGHTPFRLHRGTLVR